MRPIDADAIKLPKGFFEEVDNVPKFYEWLNEQPTIEPKKGKWIELVDCNTVQCSECFDDFDYIDGLYYLCHGQELPNYCPNCGARMSEVSDECAD